VFHPAEAQDLGLAAAVELHDLQLRFEAIGWVSGIREAERRAKESGRPVFLFSNVGQMGLGRC